MKKIKIVYWVSTGLLTAFMLLSVSLYFFQHEMIQEAFISFGYPTYLIYPIAFAKLLGLVAVWTKKIRVLTEWAYAGFFFDFLLAFFAHVDIRDGEYAGPLVAITLLLVSYNYMKKLQGKPEASH